MNNPQLIAAGFSLFLPFQIFFRYTHRSFINKMGDVTKGAKIFKTKCSQCEIVVRHNCIQATSTLIQNEITANNKV